MNAKQDRQGVRTAVDLERKYSFQKQFTTFSESVNTNSNDINALSSRVSYELDALSTETDEQIDKTNQNVTNLSSQVVKLDAAVENMTDGFTIIVNGVATGDANNPNRVVIDGNEVRLYVNSNLVQTFTSSGAVSTPVLNVTALMTLLGLQIEETATNIDCYYGGKIVWSFLKSGGEIVGVAVGKKATEEVFEVALPVTFPSNDIVVDHGVIDGWTYRKWDSGLAECWKIVEYSTTVATAWGGMYVGNAIARQNYPFAFTEKPVEVVTLTSGSKMGFIYPEQSGYGVNGAYASARYNVASLSSYTTAVTYYFNYHVMGRWK
jgi:hypothetical protein